MADHDDRRHRPVAPDFVEQWDAWWCDERAALGGAIVVTLRGAGAATFAAAFVGAGRPPVVVVADDLAVPAALASLELRGDGLWADHTVEEPLVHMSCNLEAFGVEVDTLDGVGADTPGVRVPFGYELDLVTSPTPTGVAPDARYLDCRVEGVVLVGAESIDVDGVGVRRHHWGPATSTPVADLVEVLRDPLARLADLL